MRTLTGSDFLHLWERGGRLHPLDRALLALSVALPEVPFDTLADWPLGRRNVALAELRCASFGAVLEAFASCPLCREALEFEMDAKTYLLDPANRDIVPRFSVNGRTYRPPSSRDMAMVIEEPDAGLAAIRLVERCRLEGEEPLGLPEQELEEVGEQMALADPMAEIRISLKCPECGHEWDDPLELVGFIWSEVEARAKRLLWQVHELASAYGWTERDVLSLSEARRALYLDMVSG